MAGIFNRAIFNDDIFNTDPVIWHPIRRRRGRYRPRYDEIVERINRSDEDAVAKQHAEHIIAQAREIASARTDLEISKRMMKAGQEKIVRIRSLEARVLEAEERMAMLHEEEDFIMLLAFSV